MTSRILLPIGYLAATVVMVSAACSSQASSEGAQIGSAGMAKPQQSLQADPRYLGSDLPLLPTGVVSAVRPIAVMRATYEFAAKHPEVMHYVPCFCGCERGGHKDNHDCFVSSRGADGKVTGWEGHAVGCEVCVDVAYQAWQMHSSGSTVPAIREAIEKKFAGFPGGHTPTPMPKRGGTSHD